MSERGKGLFEIWGPLDKIEWRYISFTEVITIVRRVLSDFGVAYTENVQETVDTLASEFTGKLKVNARDATIRIRVNGEKRIIPLLRGFGKIPTTRVSVELKTKGRVSPKLRETLETTKKTIEEKIFLSLYRTGGG
ncbi:hypothetical protein KEJ26_04280 [Candidatus Bathyarchaeota archaeon]|nr:hypothetical protein [Candidatus Bathyarchaeota archaeon]